jgi:hypothetical protein
MRTILVVCGIRLVREIQTELLQPWSAPMPMPGPSGSSGWECKH